jgi:hypothetical protein
MVLWVCERCGVARLLLAEIDRTLLCAECWRAWGSLFWNPTPPSAEATHAAELAIRESMQKRGGADAYRVKAGKT